MSGLSVFKKAVRIIEENRIRLTDDVENAWYFEIDEPNEPEGKIEISVRKNGGIRAPPCSCKYGIYQGMKGAMCRHQIACLLFLGKKVKEEQ